jgi:hypothetical protein
MPYGSRWFLRTSDPWPLEAGATNMEGKRMLTVVVEQDSRKLGGSTLLIPFDESWLANNSCRELLANVLCEHLELSNVLASTSQVDMFCMQQQESTSGSGRKARVDKELSNATACSDCKVLYVIESFSTHSFRFMIILVETPAPATSAKATVNPFNIMMQSQVNYTFLPPLLSHERVYANHCLYNELIGFLESTILGGRATSLLLSGSTS